MNNKYGSRKFMIYLMSLAVTTWALFEGLIPSADFKAILIGIIGIYGAANVGQKVWAKEVTGQ